MDITVSDEVSQEYHALVKNILCNREFLKLSLYTHHQWTTRLMHSINVSYLSWFIARKLGCDEKAAARAGLLHDFCPYDFRAETPTGEHQAFYHPKAAADNSAAHFDVTDSQLEEAKQFESFEELVEYIRERHAYYLESPRCIADDIRFILRVCYQVVQGIFQLCVRKQFHMGGQPAVTV